MNRNGGSNENLRAAAEFLAKDHLETEPNLRKIYWFPADDEVRLIDVYADAIPVRDGDPAAAFFFGPDIKGGVPYRYAIALVRPEEDRRIPLPNGWGEWSDGVILWEAK